MLEIDGAREAVTIDIGEGDHNDESIVATGINCGPASLIVCFLNEPTFLISK